MAFDLDAAAAEACGEQFEFTWQGAAYVMPNDLPLDVAARIREGFEVVLRLALGDDVWEAMPVKPGVKASQLVVDAWFDHLGVSAGNSNGPSENSENTASG